MGTCELSGKVKEMQGSNQEWTGIPAEGSNNTTSHCSYSD